jgi:TRAP-type mannitol/chloroaromatic compound transport system substrate-binding protein
VVINKQVFDGLPKDLQSIVVNACKVANLDMLSEYMARNPAALSALIKKHKVELREFPQDVVRRLRELSAEVVAEVARQDEFSKRVYASHEKFLEQVRKWSDISELTYLKARNGV